VPVKTIVVADDALARVPDLLRSAVRGRRVTLVADTRTQAVAGAEVVNRLAAAGWRVQPILVPDTHGATPVCDDNTLAWLQSCANCPDALVAVGSGVINDLTKWLAHGLDKPYLAVATAASMNGYASANVAPTIAGVKTLVWTRAPFAIVTTPTLLREAPYELTAAGLGDVIAKASSIADWRMNQQLFGDHFCPFCAEIINDIEPAYLHRPEALRLREWPAISGLFDALIYSGLAMTMIGTSSPASGGEHVLSHALDMLSLRDGTPHDLHGRQVGIGTIFASALYERLFSLRHCSPREMPDSVDDDFWGSLAPAVQSQYAGKRERYALARAYLMQADALPRLQAVLAPYLRTPRAIADCLARAGAARFVSDIGCSPERLHAAVLHMHQMRTRFTVVDLAWVAGILPDDADEIIRTWLVG
jgi:glycerol-1-phosphate dehydrogenase [NAD(P)+]